MQPAAMPLDATCQPAGKHKICWIQTHLASDHVVHGPVQGDLDRDAAVSLFLDLGVHEGELVRRGVCVGREDLETGVPSTRGGCWM